MIFLTASKLLIMNKLKNIKTVQKEVETHGFETELKAQGQDMEFMFEISFLKGIKISAKGIDKESIKQILKSIFSISKPIFWYIISHAVFLIYLVIKHSELVVKMLSDPP